MKRIIALIIVSFFALACQKTSVDKKDDIIKYKQSVTLNDVPRAALTFFEVSDSRCPKGVQCIWAGNATVDLAMEGVGTEGKISEHVNMCIGDCRTLYKSSSFRTADTVDREFAGQKYRLILDAVDRLETENVKNKENYFISLRIEKR